MKVWLRILHIDIPQAPNLDKNPVCGKQIPERRHSIGGKGGSSTNHQPSMSSSASCKRNTRPDNVLPKVGVNNYRIRNIHETKTSCS